MNTKDYVSNDKKSDSMIRALEQHMPPAPVPEPPSLAVQEAAEIQDDYEFSRRSYRDLVDKSNTAIESMLELAMQAEHPRAFEVLSTMLKNTSEITDKLMDLQKKKKEVREQPKSAGGAPQLTQTNIFTGSTKELQQMMIKKLAEKNVSDTSPAL
jgi:hypothetical protein